MSLELISEDERMAIRLIAFDMDDTLLRDDRTIGERTLRALRAAHEQGVKIIPATGRGKHSMWNFVQQMGVADAAICTNGGQARYGAPRAAGDRAARGALCEGERVVFAGIFGERLFLRS